MPTPIRDGMADNSTRDGTNDTINGSEVDANPNTIADILDGTTTTRLNQATGNGMVIESLEIADVSVAAGGVRTALRVRHDPASGTVTDADGVEVLFQGDDDDGTKTDFAELEVVFNDVTNATEDAEFVFKTLVAGTAREVFSVGSQGAVFNEDSQDLDFRIETDNITTAFVVDASADQIDIGANVAIANSTGLVVGHTSRIVVGVSTPEFEVLGTGAADSALVAARWDNSSGSKPSRVYLGRSRNASIGSFTVVQADDWLGQIAFVGDDGTDMLAVAAEITGVVDGTPGTGDMPGRLIFSTTADGAETTTERARIDSSGNLGLNATSFGSSAAGVLAIGNGTQGAANANMVQLVSEDLSAGNTILSIRTEGSGAVATGTPASADGAIAIKVNGTVRYLTYSDSAPS